MAQAAVAAGKCVVIGLQSTGEARTADVVLEKGEELDDFVSGGCCVWGECVCGGVVVVGGGRGAGCVWCVRARVCARVLGERTGGVVWWCACKSSKSAWGAPPAPT